jgi:hypothetical protein
MVKASCMLVWGDLAAVQMQGRQPQTLLLCREAFTLSVAKSTTITTQAATGIS